MAATSCQRLKRPAAAFLLETLLVLASPVMLFFVLRLRLMAPVGMPDPTMHTIYIIDPRDFFARYTSELVARAGMREGARVGFLVPARLSYLAFGPVPGFIVFRYVLALVAVVPSYVLLRRLYGRGAGVVAIVIFMSNPVFVTALGTDYPDSAVVSYLAGGLACLAMPCRPDRRPIWLAIGAGLLTTAVWANVAAAPLVAVTLMAYVVICLRARRRDLVDALVVFTTAAVVTVGLMLASGLLLGPFDYIVPTIRAFEFLERPAVVRLYHSTNWRWILLRSYLLVPVAVVVAWGATFLRRLRSIPTPQLLVGGACIAQLAVFGYLQFLSNAETLEQHYYSSSLWAATCLVLAITVGALAKPLLERPMTCWLPAVLVLAVPLIYEMDPHPPAFGWLPAGLLIVTIMIVAVGVRRFSAAKAVAALDRIGAALAIFVMVGCSLILTVAPHEHHAPLPGTINDPVPAYATALGGSAVNLVDQYRVATELPQFVGNSTYPSERLLMWFPAAEIHQLVELNGMYHGEYNSLSSSPPLLTRSDRWRLNHLKPAELLVFDTPNFAATIRALAHYDPTLLRATVLASGGFAVHVWLISLGVFMKPNSESRRVAD